MNRLKKLAFFPYPIRLAIAQKIKSWRRGFSRQHYLVCVERAAKEAIPLGYRHITVIEFGVAAGKGLTELERICDHVERKYSLRIDLFGFDTGTGLPKPTDYRDTPWEWTEGWYQMDVEVLRARLTRAELVLGDVAETVPVFMEERLRAPIGAVMFDLDYYTATRQALRIFESERAEAHMPRALCYFDDLGSIEDVGVPRAIAEFNEKHQRRKIKPQLFWQHQPDPYLRAWKLYEFHHFDHPDYQKLLRSEDVL